MWGLKNFFPSSSLFFLSAPVEIAHPRPLTAIALSLQAKRIHLSRMRLVMSFRGGSFVAFRSQTQNERRQERLRVFINTALHPVSVGPSLLRERRRPGGRSRGAATPTMWWERRHVAHRLRALSLSLSLSLSYSRLIPDLAYARSFRCSLSFLLSLLLLRNVPLPPFVIHAYCAQTWFTIAITDHFVRQKLPRSNNKRTPSSRACRKICSVRVLIAWELQEIMLNNFNCNTVNCSGIWKAIFLATLIKT